MTAIQLIVGLGNPGERYQQTRHNIGFWFVDEILSKYNGYLKNENKFQGEVGKLSIAGHSVWVIKPQTFMNLSGNSVAAICRFYHIDITECLVVHDELDISIGELRLKRDGGHGGHNGLRHIMEHQGKQFMRLRIGIGHPGEKHLVSPYLLNPISNTQYQQLMESVQDASDSLPLILEGDWEKAMHQLHSRKPDQA